MNPSSRTRRIPRCTRSRRHKVRYHSVDGAVIFTATVDSDRRARERSPALSMTVDVPAKVDESGNPVLDERRRQSRRWRKSPWHTTRTPTAKIVALLDEQCSAIWRRASRALPGVAICALTVAAAKSWDEFKNEPVKRRHGPVSRDVSAWSPTIHPTPQSQAIRTMATAQLRLAATTPTPPTQSQQIATDKAPFKVVLCCSRIMGTQLTVTVTQASYRPWSQRALPRSERMPVNGKLCLALQLGFG